MSIKSNDIEDDIANILDLEKGMSAGKMVWFRSDIIELGPKDYQKHSENMQAKVNQLLALIETTVAEARIDELEQLLNMQIDESKYDFATYIPQWKDGNFGDIARKRLEYLKQLTRNKESQSSVKPEKSGSRDLVAKRSETATPKVDEALVRNYTDQKWLDETNKEVK